MARQETNDQEELFTRFGDHLPREMEIERELQLGAPLSLPRGLGPVRRGGVWLSLAPWDRRRPAGMPEARGP